MNVFKEAKHHEKVKAKRKMYRILAKRIRVMEQDEDQILAERTIEYIRDNEHALLHVLERITEYYDQEKKHLKEIRLVVDGQISSHHRGFYLSGRIKFRYHYTRGIPNGNFYDYDKNGKVIT